MWSNLQQYADEAYEAYKNYNLHELIIYGKALLAFSEEESTPNQQFYSHTADQFMKGNPFVPFNNPVDATLNYARVTTYDRSTMEQFKNVANTIDRDRKIIACCFAYMFLYKAHQLDVSNTEILQYIKDIIRRVNTINQSKINNHKDMLLTARSIFKNFNSNKWIQECDNFLNSETKILSQERENTPNFKPPMPFSEEQTRNLYNIYMKVVQTDPNDVSALTSTALEMFTMSKSIPDMQTKIKNYEISENLFNGALYALKPKLHSADRKIKVESIEKANKIVGHQIELYKEMQNIGMQKDYKKIVSQELEEIEKRIAELGKSTSQKRLKYYTADGKPIYE